MSIPLELATVVSRPFDENTYILRRPDRDDCAVVDPGLEPDKIVDLLDQRGWTPAIFLNTHGHSDHIGGNAAMKQRWSDVPLVIGEQDAAKLTDPWQNLSGQFGIPIVSPPADRLVREGDTVEAAGFAFHVLHTPGHSIGHVVFVLDEEPTIVLGGDVLFAGSVGRTDFPDGDFASLLSSIHEKLFALDDSAIVLPGHGPATTIGAEKRTNPLVGAPAGYRFDDEE
jgi:glyoxylase-like metal-dependent hydrolase (beta-lactamase superfamily II)